MMAVSDLPALNAFLNGLAGVLLVMGFVNVKRGNVELHRKFMLSAFGVSVLFLISYTTYHFNQIATPFTGEGAVRYVYFFILITHIILAAALLPLVIITLRRGLKDHRPAHRKIARWTFPIWLYVSVTGVAVYLMLYQFYPSAP